MSKLLPKGHVSCLSSTFQYTPATHTNIANTFARIKRELTERNGVEALAQRPVELVPVFRGRTFRIESVEAAWQFLRGGGLRSMPRLAPSSGLSDA